MNKTQSARLEFNKSLEAFESSAQLVGKYPTDAVIKKRHHNARRELQRQFQSRPVYSPEVSKEALADAFLLQEEMTCFMQIVLILLHELSEGFEGALEFGGTGVYGNHLAWRTFSFEKKLLPEAQRVIDEVRALFPRISSMFEDKVMLIREHIEDNSINLIFRSPEDNPIRTAFGLIYPPIQERPPNPWGEMYLEAPSY